MPDESERDEDEERRAGLPVNTAERWTQAYVEAPEIFDAFCRAEDPEGRISARLLAVAALEGCRVLEIGCGTGRYTREWAPHAASYLALERSPGMLALARAAAGTEPAWVCADAARLPLADASVDRVLAGWVVVNLRPDARAAVLAEAARVLRPGVGAGTWLVENHWSGEFQALRGRRPEIDETRLRRLVEVEGFALVDVVRTELRFASSAEARRILGYLCGEVARRALVERSVARLTHHVVILHRPAPPPLG